MVGEEQFRQFFDSAPWMGEFLEGPGITDPREISVFNSLDVPGTFSRTAPGPGPLGVTDIREFVDRALPPEPRRDHKL